MPETLDSLRRSAIAYRRSGRRRLSDEIKRDAVQLLSRHSSDEVARAVRVSSGSVVEGWRQRFGELASPIEPATFVEVPGTVLACPDEPSNEVEVEVVGHEGQRLRLRGRLDSQQLVALVTATLGGSA